LWYWFDAACVEKGKAGKLDMRESSDKKASIFMVA